MGGSVSVPSLGSEIGQVTGGFSKNLLPTFNQFVKGNPLLSTLGQYGLGLAGAAYPELQQVISSGGALTPQETNLATQQARSAFQARGNVFGNQAVAGEALNRDQYKWQKLQQAMGMGGQALQFLGYPAQTQAGVFSSLINPLYGLAGQQLQASTSAQEANQSKQADLIGAGIQSVGSIAGGVAMSDRRLKTDIRDTGEKTPEGIPIKGFRYKGDKRRYIGVMAQDVAKRVQSAVIRPSWMKYAAVDYSKIVAPFQEVASRETSSDKPSWMQYATA